MRKSLFFILLAAMGCLLSVSCGGRRSGASYAEADSLNRLSYDLRYKNLKEAARTAALAYRLSEGHAELRAEALNNLGFCAFMQMDFEQASRLFTQAAGESCNEIEHLVSDVGMMKISQRTSMNKAFYDYRNSALRRMERIREDAMQITDVHDKARLDYALSEFYIVSGIYFYYLQQHKESLASIDSVAADVLEKHDTAQWLYYEYMRGSGGMYEAPTREQRVKGEFAYLADCLMSSREKGYVYFEANALQGIAEILTFQSNRKILETDGRGILRLVNDKNLPVDSLPLYCAGQALKLFKQYGDWYQISGTYRTMATYHNFAGEPEKALDCLRNALNYVNLHHEKYYHCEDTTDRLRTYIPDGGRSIELKWIVDEGIKTVPEWILRLREQLSRTYSAMGRKAESDYNRNIYLDLLDYTRQDKSWESRYTLLEKESRRLNYLISSVLVSFAVSVFLFVLLSRRWRRKNRIYMEALKQVFALCRRIIASIPLQAASTDEVIDAVLSSVKADFSRIFRAKEARITLPDDAGPGDSSPEDGDVSEKIALVLPGTRETVGFLWLTTETPLRKDEQTFLRLVLPYLAWALENGLNMVSLEGERSRLESESYVHQQHLIENKRQNIVKKACLSVVTGILPYIDRIANEIKKLESCAGEPAVREAKIRYVDELITRINEYNDILSLWIKMRRGALSLNIENFSLNELFSTIAKGSRSFSMKQLHLSVLPTEACVKADKALTLFMLNTLTENARKYTPGGGHVTVSAEEREDCVEISVTDDGTGLSPADVNRILNEKVYDAGSIGMETATDAGALQQKKGFGFGLMNCKGIIEKYRKTNKIFSVCSFDIDSTLGKGSRFSFRLPKGISRTLAIFGCIWLSFLTMSCRGGKAEGTGDEGKPHEVMYDSLLAVADYYANAVYDCNVKGEYSQALVYADSALHYMNRHYLHHSGRKSPLLNLYSEDNAAAEQDWLSQGFETDYYILLDVRNEVAVAALAVQEFRLYYYNNLSYTVLYKQLSEDRSLEQYCEQMQQSANNRTIALVLLVLFILSFFLMAYLLYFRRRRHYRDNMEQVFAVNTSIFSTAHNAVSATDEHFGKTLIEGIFEELNELVPIADMALAMFDEDSSSLKYSFYSDGENDALRMQMQRCFDKGVTAWNDANDAWSYFILAVSVGGESHSVGVAALKISREYNREEDRLLVELVMSYLSVVLYNAVIRVKRKYSDIELAQDEARRTRYEENLLHVQNMVLDNCLSTIKHETIYYPNRIKNIIDSLRNGRQILSQEEERRKLKDMEELVDYYRDVFTTLTGCASRQLDEKNFRRADLSVASLADGARTAFRKIARKLPYDLRFDISEQPSGMSVSGDKVLLSFLLESLLNEAARYPESGVLELKIREENGFVRFDFVDMRRTFSQETLNNLFYPSLSLFRKEGDENTSAGAEYLICKQIIREHDENGGKRGCRINATALEQGFGVWFTIPKSNHII